MKPKTTLYLVRHGEVVNPDDILYMRLPGFPLSEIGRRQVRVQGEKINIDAESSGKVAAIYHSPLLRTTQTAEILEEVLKTGVVKVDKRLTDVKTPLEGKITFAEFLRTFHGFLYHDDLVKKGGETIRQMWLRMMLAGDKLLREYKGRNLVIVSHGDPIQIFKLGYQGVDIDKVTEGILHDEYFPSKGSVTKLEFEEGKLKNINYWPPE